MHFLSLYASILADEGSLQESGSMWEHAEKVARLIGAASHAAYFKLRREFSAIPPSANSHSIRKADQILRQLSSVGARENELKAQLTRALKHFHENLLDQYEFQAFRIVSDRLARKPRARYLFAAMEASILSIIVCVRSKKMLDFAMESHMRWLGKLRLPPRDRVRSEKHIHAWLDKQFGESVGNGMAGALASLCNPTSLRLPASE
jgi:hypothetical protein